MATCHSVGIATYESRDALQLDKRSLKIFGIRCDSLNLGQKATIISYSIWQRCRQSLTNFFKTVAKKKI
jgi:hypothetical protein